MFWIILIAVFLLGLIALLLLRFRVQVDIDSDRQLVFLGLGQSGSYLDLGRKTGEIRVARLSVRRFRLAKEPAEKKPKKAKPEKEAKPKKKKPARKRSIPEMLKLLPRVSYELMGYLWHLFTGCIVEQLEGDIEAGFDSPDITGCAYGYYQAALGAAPVTVGRLNFVPVWTEACFSGAFRASVALPLYRVLYQTVRLLFRLPILKILMVVRGKKEGDIDVQQRS